MPHPDKPQESRKLRRANRQNSKKRRFFPRWLRISASSAALFIVALFVVGFWVPWGIRARLLVAETIISTRHYQYARWITTPKEYNALVLGLTGTKVQASNPHGVTISGNTPDVPNVPSSTLIQNSVIKVVALHQNGYTGDVIFVSNPKLVRLVPAQVSGQEGEYITHMAPRLGAIAGINASGFEDPKGEGWGGVPVGLMYIHGVEFTPPKQDENWATAGFTQDGILVLGNFTRAELSAQGVRDAMQFHPELVVNGQPMITQGDGGMGFDPRTAIGQTKNGTVIMIVINGRLRSGSIGATQKEVMELMLSYGAVNAVALDGGSSSVMTVNGHIMNSPSTLDPNGERHLPDAWLVFPTLAAANAADGK